MSPIRYFVLTVLVCVSFVLTGFGSGIFLRQETAVDSIARSVITTDVGAVQVSTVTPPPQPSVPIFSIHNPLVIPIGDSSAALRRTVSGLARG